MDAKDIKDLILTIDQTTIETVEIEKADMKLRITKKAAVESPSVEKSHEKNLAGESKNIKVVHEDQELIENHGAHSPSNPSAMTNEDCYIVKSPIVGTFYEGASPDTPPFVKVGDRVEKGQTLCIIEAMKIMNEIECEESGEVVEIFVVDEDIVEYGQPLMRIRR